MTVDRWLSRIPLESPSVFVKLVPTLVGFVIALGLSLIPGVVAAHIPLFIVGSVAVMIGAFLLAVLVPWPRIDAHWNVVVPLVAMLSIGLLRIGTGGTTSSIGVILLLPFVITAQASARSGSAQPSMLVKPRCPKACCVSRPNRLINRAPNISP